MLHRLAGCLLVAAAFSACSQDSAPTTPTSPTPQTPTQANVRVAGRVIGYATGIGVAGQAIRWWTGSNSHLIVRPGTLNSVTDAAGRFEIDVPVTADFTPLTDTLLFDIPDTSGSVRIPAKSLETIILVNPGGCNVRYGYVYDAATRLPIAGARVSRRNAATTDANGFYRLEVVCNAPPDQSFGIGTTTISVSHPSYQGTYELDGRSEWTGRPGIRRVDFALQPLLHSAFHSTLQSFRRPGWLPLTRIGTSGQRS
jgi:hypothetical protein